MSSAQSSTSHQRPTPARAWMLKVMVMGAALLPLTPVWAEAPAKATRSPSALSVRTQAEVENIAALIEALRTFAGRASGKYPTKIEELVQKNVLSADEFKRLTTSPLDSTGGLQTDGYLYYLEGKSSTSAPDEVLIMGKNPLAPADSRRAVGKQDGSVIWWKRPQVDAFLKTGKKAK